MAGAQFEALSRIPKVLLQGLPHSAEARSPLPQSPRLGARTQCHELPFEFPQWPGAGGKVSAAPLSSRGRRVPPGRNSSVARSLVSTYCRYCTQVAPVFQVLIHAKGLLRVLRKPFNRSTLTSTTAQTCLRPRSCSPAVLHVATCCIGGRGNRLCRAPR